MDLALIANEKMVDADFCIEHQVPPVRTYTLRDVVRTYFSSSHWLSELFQNADLIHINGHWRLEHYLLTRLAKRFAVPYVLHPRGMMLVGHRKVLLKRAYNLLVGNRVVQDAARVVALSDFERRHFKPYPLSAQKIWTVPNSIQIPGKIDLSSVRYDHFFLYFGRIEARKNLHFLLRAFDLYRRQGGSASLLLVGPSERDYDEALQREIARLGITGSVRILPPVFGAKKWSYLAKATAVIYPAKEEPFGRVPFEAVACGSYPLIPNESGGAEYLRDVLPDCTYEDGDPSSLAGKLALVEGQRPDMGRARQWISENLNPAAVADRFFGLYRGLLEQT